MLLLLNHHFVILSSQLPTSALEFMFQNQTGGLTTRQHTKILGLFSVSVVGDIAGASPAGSRRDFVYTVVIENVLLNRCILRLREDIAELFTR